MGPEAKRRLKLRNLPNEELIRLYDSELVLRLHNPKNLTDTRKILALFIKQLGHYPPSAELAKGFLAQYAARQPRTLYRYAQMIKAFMKWYGEPIDDLKIKIPKSIPKYTEDAVISQVREAFANKKTHKGSITRDLLLFDLDHQSGLRRSELSNLLVNDIHTDFLEVRKGKGQKDRVVPLTSSMALRLHNYIKEKRLHAEDKLFDLTAGSISNKIRQFADKAGVPDLHTHSLRHKFATNLLEQGTNIRVVQDLMGHENLNTTQVYLSITDKARKEAIDQLDKPRGTAPRKFDTKGKPDLTIPDNQPSLDNLPQGYERHSQDLAEVAKTIYDVQQYILSYEQNENFHVIESPLVSGFFSFQPPPKRQLSLPSFVDSSVSVDRPDVEYFFEHLCEKFSELNLNSWRDLLTTKLPENIIEKIKYWRNTTKFDYCPTCEVCEDLIA